MRLKIPRIERIADALVVLAVLAAALIAAASAIAGAPPTTGLAPVVAPDPVRIVVLAEGYTQDDRARFDEHFSRVRDAILATEPFSSERVEVVASFRASNARLLRAQRGDTAYQGYVDTGTVSIGDAHALMFADIAASGADYALMLFNSSLSAGSARFGVGMLTAARDDAGHVALHELGHTVAGLIDEYCKSGCSRVWTGGQHPAPNLSAVGEPLKWQLFVGAGLLGAPVEGGNLYASGVYRPAQSTKMRSTRQPFSPVDIAALRMALRDRRVISADIDCDGRVGFSDLNTVLSNFGRVSSPGALEGDINGDGVVNMTDLNLILSRYGQGVLTESEPAGASSSHGVSR